MDALKCLENLVDQSLFYGLKSPDMDLYDFGFGNVTAVRNVQKKTNCTHFLHAVCRFKIIWMNRERRVDIYSEDTPCEKFHNDIKRLIGLSVKRIALSDKNDLWIDFGNYWLVLITYDNEEESWRFFTNEINAPHLIAGDKGIVCVNPNEK